MQLRIRDATDDDTDSVGRLLGELGYDVDEVVLVERLDAARRDGHFLLVAAVEDRVLGVVSAAVVPLLAEADAMVRITALSVTGSARRRGVARLLVETVEQRARELGAAVVEVGSGRRPERATAHRFYPALGFEDANHAAARYWKWLDRGA